MRDRLVIIDAVKELMKVEGNTRERVVEMVMKSHKVTRSTIYAYLSDESSIRLNKPEARVLKIESHGSGRPTQLSRPSWFPLSRGYCFSWCAKQKRHQRTNARSYAQEVGESLRRVFGCHSVSAFRKKSPQRKIIVSSFSSKTIVIFFILFPN